MSILTVPTWSDPSWTQSTTFEGTKYMLQCDYNQRGACWYLSIADQDGVDIDNGIKLTVGPLLLKKCKDPRRPPGELIVVSNTTDTTPPGLSDLIQGTGRCGLYYITSDWVAILSSGNAAAIAGITTQIQAGGNASSAMSNYGQPGN
jgi:hypothetical protein